MSKSLTDRYIPPTHKSVALEVKDTVSDIQRILALPRRPPVDCERDPITKRYPPATEALIGVMTERFSRGRRLSCACRPRRVTMLMDGSLEIMRVMPEGLSAAVVYTSVQAFVADTFVNGHTTAVEVATSQAVMALKPGQTLELVAADGGMGHPCIDRLNAVQAWFLREAAQVGGVVGFCGVGSGKSIAFILAALLFTARLGMLLIEPKQRRHYRSQYLRTREHFRVGSIVFDDGQPGYTVPGTMPLHLLSYSVVSQTKNTGLLDERDPDALMLDEAHKACGDSAINRRVKRFAASKIQRREEALARGDKVRARALNLLDASGTLESEGVEDTQMLCAYSLGTGSPLPLDPIEAGRWSAVMDRSYMPDRQSATALMLQRVFGGGVVDPQLIDIGDGPEKAIRKGFCDWRLHTPGIISASASSIGASIYLIGRDPPKMPQSVKDALMDVRTKKMRPDGEVLEEKVEQVSCARHVACGFYTYWAFPKHKCECVPPPPAPVIRRCKECILIDDWYAKRKAYSKDLRAKLLIGEVHLDSPANCEAAAERFFQQPKYEGPLPVWACETWPAWRDIEHQVEYEEREKWIKDGGDFLVKDAAEWAAEHKGVIWVQSRAFGNALSKMTGLPFYNGGVGTEERMRAEKGNRSIICSIKAHGAGTDGLQYIYNKQLIVETPASNASQEGYEQLFGRLHREGQQKPEVWTWGYFHVPELLDALRSAIAQAEINFEMTKNRQKLLCTDRDIKDL